MVKKEKNKIKVGRKREKCHTAVEQLSRQYVKPGKDIGYRRIYLADSRTRQNKRVGQNKKKVLLNKSVGTEIVAYLYVWDVGSHETPKNNGKIM